MEGEGGAETAGTQDQERTRRGAAGGADGVCGESDEGRGLG